MNYYRRYLVDYMRDTMALSIVEHGAYTILLDSYYASEKPLPEDYESLYRICRAMTKLEQDAVRGVVDKFFAVGEDGFRHNPRADREIATAQAAIDKQRKSGVESANKRWSTHTPINGSTHKSVNGSSDGLAMQPPTTNHQPPSFNHQPKAKTGRAIALPDWLPKEPWEAWLDTRKKMRAPNTDRALKLAVGDLEKLRSEGHDPGGVLDQSTKRGWRGLFPISHATGHVPDYSGVAANIKD